MRHTFGTCLGLIFVICGALSAACSADSAGRSPSTGGGPSSGGNGGGSSGAIGVGGSNVGGSGAGINIDAGLGGGGSGNDAACAETTAAAGPPQPVPADIIWAVDQSGSMNQETAYVQSKINAFANQIAATSIDYRVIMIAATIGGNAICVPPPLSGGGCGNGPRFRLVNVGVDSNDALNKIIATYPMYSDFLRPNSVKHFVVVTDDNATDGPNNSPQAFINSLNGLTPPGMFSKWKFHSIFAYGTIPVVGCLGPFGTGAAIGVVYDQLVSQTGGAKGVICVDNWQPVFDQIKTAVVQGSKVSCDYTVPDPGGGQTLDPNKVNVDYLPGGNPPAQAIYRVDDLSKCKGGGSGGWYFDNNAAPTKILLCPATCTAVQSDANAKIDVKFGCDSIYQPPA
ncbi:MAG: hypothetical protein R3B13_37000 [Polyangiaceae bacterium]